jgi:hypothetical protein
MTERILLTVLAANGIQKEPYMQLEKIGGHKTYHLEGNALEHSYLVWKASREIFPENRLMQKVALLHDIGKIYGSIQLGENDWIYPDHSTIGSCRGVLCKFIPLELPNFKEIQWMIKNHIKPLFWKKNGISFDSVEGLDPKICSAKNLALLAVCDLMGSQTVNEAQKQADIDYLLDIAKHAN